ncbi:hypothetical protein [Kribbella deserti]|uniref:Uncharacterized protein n=1 Tax=Kribbella deserti TaxID=1926257 RepID=A0ABV6QQ47_9ACTN
MTAQLELDLWETREIAEQLPTLPGKVEGIVGWDPMVLQCRDCGVTYKGTRRPATDIILSGFHFHVCEGRDGKRRCPDCLAAVKAACPRGHS